MKTWSRYQTSAYTSVSIGTEWPEGKESLVSSSGCLVPLLPHKLLTSDVDGTYLHRWTPANLEGCAPLCCCLHAIFPWLVKAGLNDVELWEGCNDEGSSKSTLSFLGLCVFLLVNWEQTVHKMPHCFRYAAYVLRAFRRISGFRFTENQGLPKS
jgi:hypothetical protein